MGNCLKNVKIIGFLTFSGTHLNKMKDNLGQECVKGGLLSFQGKIETIAPAFRWKNDSFSSFDPTFHLPKIWISHPNKNYIFEMSNNRANCWKSFIIISLRLWIW